MNIKKEIVRTLQSLVGIYFGKTYSKDELNISDKSVGGKVEIVTADGTLAPAEDGDYAMEDGFAFTVKDGMIESIVGQDAPAEEEAPAEEDKPVEEAAEIPAEAPVEEAPAEEVEAPAEEVAEDTAVADLQTAVADLTAKVDACMKALESMNMEKQNNTEAIEKFTKEVAELNNNIQTLAKVPVNFSKTNTSKFVEESKEEKLLSIAQMIGSINK